MPLLAAPVAAVSRGLPRAAATRPCTAITSPMHGDHVAHSQRSRRPCTAITSPSHGDHVAHARRSRRCQGLSLPVHPTHPRSDALAVHTLRPALRPRARSQKRPILIRRTDAASHRFTGSVPNRQGLASHAPRGVPEGLRRTKSVRIPRSCGNTEMPEAAEIAAEIQKYQKLQKYRNACPRVFRRIFVPSGLPEGLRRCRSALALGGCTVGGPAGPGAPHLGRSFAQCVPGRVAVPMYLPV